MVLTTKGIDDLSLKEFVEAGAMAVRRCKKDDLRRIARATGATLVGSLANLEGDETFEPSLLGLAEEVVLERISDEEVILIKGSKVVSSASIILRGANGTSALAPFRLGADYEQTTCSMKWSEPCTIRYRSSRERSRVAASWPAEAPSKQRSAFI